MEGTVFLPYHCPTLGRGNFLRSPCAAKVAEAKERRAKFPGAVLGALEHCLACEGRNLVTREAPAVLDKKSQLKPDVEKPMAAVKFMNEADAEKVLGSGKIPPVTTKEDLRAHGAAMKYTGDIRLEVYFMAPAYEAPRCPKHPNEPRMVCSESSKRAGQFLGACKICLAERKVGRKPGAGLEKMTPAVARDLKRAPSVSKSSPPVDPAPAAATPAAASPAAPIKINKVQIVQGMCLTHNLPIKFNAKGFSMGGCEECRREISALGGHKARIILAQNPLERIFADYSAELAWLYALAGKLVRTPEAQLVFLVRQAMAGDGQVE